MSTSSNAEDTTYTEFRDALNELESIGREASSLSASRDASAAAANPIQQFCQIWPTAKRVLETVLKIPFIPGNVKTVIRTLIGAGDLICRSS